MKNICEIPECSQQGYVYCHGCQKLLCYTHAHVVNIPRVARIPGDVPPAHQSNLSVRYCPDCFVNITPS